MPPESKFPYCTMELLNSECLRYGVNARAYDWDHWLKDDFCSKAEKRED